MFLFLLKEEYFILKSTIGRGWIKHENQHFQKMFHSTFASALILSISIRSLKKALNLWKNQTIDANSTKLTFTFINFIHKYIKMLKDSYYQKNKKKTYVRDVKIFLNKKNKKSTIWTWTNSESRNKIGIFIAIGCSINIFSPLVKYRYNTRCFYIFQINTLLHFKQL